MIQERLLFLPVILTEAFQLIIFSQHIFNIVYKACVYPNQSLIFNSVSIAADRVAGHSKNHPKLVATW